MAGEFRSRKLKTLAGRAVRPTSDRLRETLFNVLGEAVVGKVFVDAYAGSGAVGIEALSRGAARAVFIERDRRAVAVIRENLRALGLEERAQVVPGEAGEALRRVRGDVVFLDPPYRDVAGYEESLGILGEIRPELVVAEHGRRLELAECYGALRRTRVLTQGDSSLSFYLGLRPSVSGVRPG